MRATVRSSSSSSPSPDSEAAESSSSDSSATASGFFDLGEALVLAVFAFAAGAAVPSSFLDFLLLALFSAWGLVGFASSSDSLSSSSLRKSAARLRGLICLAGSPLSFSFEADFFAADAPSSLFFFRIDFFEDSLGASAGFASAFLVFFAGESAAAAAAAARWKVSQQMNRTDKWNILVIFCQNQSDIPLRLLSFLVGAMVPQSSINCRL